MGQSRSIVRPWDCLMVSFVCSHCGRTIQVPEDQTGQKVKCSCGQMVTVSIGKNTAAMRSPGIISHPAAGEETTALPAHEEPERGTASELDTGGNNSGTRVTP